MLEIRDVGQVKSGRDILRSISITVPEHSIFMLMGPTGCGKTTLLRIAGMLDKAGSGEVSFESTERSDGIATRLQMAVMLQYPVLFHGRVGDNIEWALKVRKFSKTEIRNRLTEALEVSGLVGMENRNINGLSGGEKQRVALARVIALRPELLLLDEPASSLDPVFRIELLKRLKAYTVLHGITVLMTTHNLEDALSIGSAGAIMNCGCIEQAGSLDEIFYHPATPFVASFIGMKNIYPVKFSGNTATIGDVVITHTTERQGRGFLVIPPESIVVSSEESKTSERNRYKGVVSSVEQGSVVFNVYLDIDGMEMVASLTHGAIDDLALEQGSKVYVSFKASAVHVF